MHARRTRRAFTLVELIVVVVILGILAGIGLVSYQQVTKRAQDKSIETTVASLAKEAQVLAAYRADGVFTPEDLTHATGDLPALPAGTPTAAAWEIKTAPYGVVTGYGQLHIRLAADRSAAGVAAMSQSGNCLLTRFTPTGAPAFRFVGAVGGSCSGDTALAAGPSDPVEWTDPTTAGPPAAPTGLAETLTGNNTMVLSWAANTESDLAGYRITIDGIAQPELLSSPTATIPAVPGEHTVTVVAVDKSALSSDPSAPLLAAVPPAGPAQVTAAVVHGVVSVSWTAAPGATYYRIWHQVGTAPATLLGQVSAPTTSITDTDLPAGASVTYSAAAANRGGESAATVAGTAITAPTAAPTAVTATASGTSITVGWTAPAGATGFRVYRDGAATPTWTGTAGSFTDTNLTTGATHSYVVTASNAGGESVPSAATSATTAPSVPAGLVAAAGDGSINLTWQAAPAADGYRIYRSTDGATFTLLGQATGTTFTDGSLVNGTHYWYAVAAFNGAGESGQSTAASSTPLPPVPAAPTGVTTSVTGTSVTVTWSEVDRADGYRIYKDGTLLAQVTSGTATTDTLPAGSRASYTVSAYNLAGESAQSSTASATSATAAPTGVKATAVGTTITVTWSAPAGATSFSVYRDNATTPAWTGTGTSWADTGLPAGSVHNYTVSALNAAGESAKSIPALATTVPPTPTALTATAGDGTVALSWGYDAGAQGFRVYRSTDGTTFTLLAQPVLRSYTDATAVNGTTYSYAVSGFNGAGESGQSAPASARPMPPIVATPTGVATSVSGTTATISWTAVARADGYRLYADGNLVKDITTGTSTTTAIAAGATVNYTVSAYNLSGESGQSAAAPGTAAPAAPTSVTATAASSTAITVAWTAPAGATSFAVYRDGSTTAVWAGTATSWTDNGLTAGSSHSYTVTASNAGGQSPASASATATPVPATPTGVTASISGATVTVSWSAMTGADGYRLYRNGTLLTQVTPGTVTSATDTLAAGSTASYRVSAYNLAGESSQSTTASVTAAPAAPSGVTAAGASGTSITVSWAAPAGATSFAVFRDGAAAATGSGIAGTSWTDTGLTPGTSHSYTVTAANAGGSSGRSASSNTVLLPPPVPTGLAATAGNGSVALTWATATTATGYRVYRSTDGATFTQLGQTSTTGYTDTTPVNGTSYWYAVTALNGGGESGPSTAASSKPMPPVPTAPTGVTASLSGTTATVSWSTVPGADGYRLYAGGSFVKSVTPGTAGSTTTTIAAGATVKFTVSAYNMSGEGGQSTSASVTAAPAAPTGVNATTTSSSGISLAWTPQSGATSYTVYYRVSGGTYSSVADNVSPHTFSGLNPGTSYQFYVTATNAGGTSGNSGTDTATTSLDVPAGVRVFNSTPGASGTARVMWQPSAGATAYYVQRSLNGTSGWTQVAYGTGTAATGTAASYLYYNNTGLTNGTTYWYRVAADNAATTSVYSGIDIYSAATPSNTATDTAPTGAFDTVANLGGNKVEIKGWASELADGTRAKGVKFTIGGITRSHDLSVDLAGDPISGSTAVVRNDVLNVHPGIGQYTGFDSIETGISAGTYSVCVTVYNSSTSTALTCRSVTVTN